ncbi:MAG: transposase [Acidobacteria bacterium]|nr:transposase [Acidobacteriota bacterium]
MAAFVAKILNRLGLDPVVINAAEVRAKARRPNRKSDSRDAIEICDGLRRGIYVSIVHIPPEENQMLREVLSQRRYFVRAMTRETNAVKFLLRPQGLRKIYRSLATKDAWQKLMGHEEVSPKLRGYVGMHHAAWEMARLQAEEIEGELEELSKPFKEVIARLDAVPGVGIITALTVIAFMSRAS